jgi:NADPH:quinone reductase-like Zn-dependent oxidoreductase
VREITNGEGAHVVYDGVGKDTFMASLDSLRPLGMMVSFGNASGPPPEFSPLAAWRKGLALFHAANAVSLHRDARSNWMRRRPICSM